MTAATPVDYSAVIDHLVASGHSLLQLGTTDLGYWRIDGIASNSDKGAPCIVATLRKVLLP